MTSWRHELLCLSLIVGSVVVMVGCSSPTYINDVDPPSESIGDANPYNWIIDHAHYRPGARIVVRKAILYHGFEISSLMRGPDHVGSIIAVDFDVDVIYADKESPFSLAAYKTLEANLMSTPRIYRMYEMNADVEIRPFPARSGGYGHGGSKLGGVVVKRIYSLRELTDVKGRERSR